MCNICALALNQCIMMMMMMAMKQKGIESCAKGKCLKYVCKYPFKAFNVLHTRKKQER